MPDIFYDAWHLLTKATNNLPSSPKQNKNGYLDKKTNNKTHTNKYNPDKYQHIIEFALNPPSNNIQIMDVSLKRDL